MAINVSFGAGDRRVPGIYGPGPEWRSRYQLMTFLGKLGLRSCRFAIPPVGPSHGYRVPGTK